MLILSPLTPVLLPGRVEALGNPIACGLALLLWPVVLEAAGRPARLAATAGRHTDAPVDLRSFVEVSLVGVLIAAVPSIWSADPGIVSGVLLGIGVGATADFVASVTALVSYAAGDQILHPTASRLADRMATAAPTTTPFRRAAARPGRTRRDPLVVAIFAAVLAVVYALPSRRQ